MLSVAVALALAHALSFLGSGPVDDDFITFRYARNWVEGHGLVFNPGERFEGFTAPLWLLLVALGLELSIDPLVLTPILSIFAVAVATFAIGRVWQRRAEGVAVRWPAPALLVALSPVFAWHAVAGLGTTLLAALLALWLDAYDRAVRTDRASTAAAFWLALACLLRQEAAVFLPAYLALEWRRRRSLALLLPLVSLAGWCLFRWLYYGRLLPITYTVKKLPLGMDLAFGLRYLWDATRVAGIGALLLLGLPALRGGPGRDRGADRGRDALRVAGLGVWLHTAYVVYVGGDFVPFARFFVPTLPLVALLACEGLNRTVPRRAQALLFALGILALQWTQLERPQRFGEHRFFEERWAALGSHFAATVSANTTVAISPIGAFGWYSRLPLVDILGLTHDGVLDAVPDPEVIMKGHHRFDADWVLDEAPDHVILANGVRQPDTGKLWINPWERDLYLSSRFQESYVHMRAPIPGSEPLDVFVRRGATPLPGSIPAR